MSEKNHASRRDFLKGSAAAVAGASLLGSLSLARSAHAQGSDTLKVCLVGCGGRGQGAIRDNLDADKGLKVVAIADAFEDNAKNAAEGLRREEKYKEQLDLPDDRVFWGFDGYKKAIDSGCDIAVIATSPGFRPVHYRYAIEQNKHVMMEKPCCADAPGFRSLMETNKMADEKNRKVVVGLQRRHDPQYQETVQRIQEGALGDLSFLRVYWNGGGVWTRDKQADQTEMQYQMRNWYYFVWLSGDHICEQHVHNLDVANWIMNSPPVEANGMGGRQVRTTANGKDQGLTAGAWGQIYDHHFIEFTYANGLKVFSQCRHIPNTWSPVEEHAHGTKGFSNVGAGRIEGENAWRYRGQNVNPYKQEHVNLINAIRKDTKLNDGYHGATSSFTAVFGRMATYSGQVVKWDDAVKSGPQEFPYNTELTWDTKPPVVPGDDGSYENAVPMPGVYKPYA